MLSDRLPHFDLSHERSTAPSEPSPRLQLPIVSLSYLPGPLVVQRRRSSQTSYFAISTASPRSATLVHVLYACLDPSQDGLQPGTHTVRVAGGTPGANERFEDRPLPNTPLPNTPSACPTTLLHPPTNRTPRQSQPRPECRRRFHPRPRPFDLASNSLHPTPPSPRRAPQRLALHLLARCSLATHLDPPTLSEQRTRLTGVGSVCGFMLNGARSRGVLE